jgi:NitT/TauT family transport system substrate-binding protein
MKISRYGFHLAAAILCVAAGSRDLAAEELTAVTLVQTHPVLAIGEEVFLYAVPTYLGYFRDEGLDVSIQGANGGTPAAQALQSGAAQFATTLPESVLLMREQGGDVIAFDNLKRDNGTAIAVLPDSPIHELRDLKGKTLAGLSWGSGGTKLVAHMLTELGIGPNDYQRVTVGAGAAAAAALNSKQADAVILWDAMFAIMENTGAKMRYLDVPIQRQMAGFTLATTESYIKAHPRQVEGYCRAINKALYFTRTNVTAAVRIALKEFPALRTPNLDPALLEKNSVHIMEAWLAKAETGMPYDVKTGNLLPERWQFTENYYKGEGMLKGTKPPSEAYTNQFFEACNNFDRSAVAAAAKQFGQPS